MFWVQSVLLEPSLSLWAVPVPLRASQGHWACLWPLPGDRFNQNLKTNQNRESSLTAGQIPPSDPCRAGLDRPQCLQDTNPASSTAPGRCQTSSAFLSSQGVSALSVPSPPCSHWGWIHSAPPESLNHFLAAALLQSQRKRGSQLPNLPLQNASKIIFLFHMKELMATQKSVVSKSWSSKIIYWSLIFLI